MSYHHSTSIALLLAALLALPAAPAVVGANPGSGRVATATIGSGPVERVIVRWASTAGTDRGLTRAMRMTAAHAGSRRAAVVSDNTEAWWLPAPLSGADLRATLDEIAATPGVAEVSVDRRVTADLTPNDTYFGAWQWDMRGGYGVDATTAWDTTTGSAATVVAVIDTGITTHSEFTGRVVAGYDFISDVQQANDGNGPDPDASDPGDWITTAENASGYFQGCGASDSSWHGTHVAGTIAARGNNGVGIAGIAWEAKIQPVRVLGKCGGWTSDIEAAIRWAAGGHVTGVPDNPTPARILNLSLGGPGVCDSTMQGAITEAIGLGALVVVAAGNLGADVSGFMPANCAGVVAVGSTTSAGQRSPFSNYGTGVTISAPGSSIYSTLNAGKQAPGTETYGAYSGTSMATPHVAGVAALALAVDPSLTVSELRTLLTGTATAFAPDTSTLRCQVVLCGAGIVNAAAVVAAAMPIPTPTPTPAPTAAPSPDPIPPPTADFTTPNEGTTATVIAGATVTTAWSEGAAPGRTVAGRTLVMDEATATSAKACAAIVSWAGSTSLATSTTSRVVSVGTGGRCLRFRVVVIDSGSASGTATSGRLFVFRPGAVRVNSGAAATRYRSVSLAITAPTGAGWMRIANSSAGLAAAASRSPRRTVAWTLTSGNGTKRVYVRFGGGSLAAPVTYSDTIVLDTRAPTVRWSAMRVTARYSDGTRRVRVSLTASGTGTRLTGYQLTTRTSVPGTRKAWTNPLFVRTRATTLYLRVRDAAGNWSRWISFHPPR